jgi:hypothetical protein
MVGLLDDRLLHVDGFACLDWLNMSYLVAPWYGPLLLDGRPGVRVGRGLRLVGSERRRRTPVAGSVAGGCPLTAERKWGLAVANNARQRCNPDRRPIA